MSDKKTIDTYDAKAAEYAELVSRTTPDNDLQAFIDALFEGALVLDFGCGPGNSAKMMQDAGLVAKAIDASAEMVRVAQETNGVDAVQATFDDLDEIATYDGIWANFSLLHAPKSKMTEHLQSIHKALKPKGLFHIGMKLGAGEARDKIDRMYTYYEEDELKSFIKDAGFNIATTRQGAMEGMAGDVEPFIIITAHA